MSRALLVTLEQVSDTWGICCVFCSGPGVSISSGGADEWNELISDCIFPHFPGSVHVKKGANLILRS